MKCTICNLGNMVQKTGAKGPFMACDQYPNCRNTENMPAGAVPVPVVAEKVSSAPKATPRSSAAITATELIRYATKLHESYINNNVEISFASCCQQIQEEYGGFLLNLG